MPVRGDPLVKGNEGEWDVFDYRENRRGGISGGAQVEKSKRENNNKGEGRKRDIWNSIGNLARSSQRGIDFARGKEGASQQCSEGASYIPSKEGKKK